MMSDAQTIFREGWYALNTAQTGLAQTLADSMTPKFSIYYLRVSSRGQAERGGGDDEGVDKP